MMTRCGSLVRAGTVALAVGVTAICSGVPAPADTGAAMPPAWAAFKGSLTNVTAYTATVTMFEQQGTRVQQSVADYTFARPANATVHIVSGSNAGATIVWTGGTTVNARLGSGLMALIRKNFALHDPMITTIRGSSIDQLSFDAMVAHADSLTGTFSQSPGPTIQGVPTEAVRLVPASADAGLTDEVADMSTVTNLPVRMLGYEDGKLVRQLDFADIKLTR